MYLVQSLDLENTLPGEGNIHAEYALVGICPSTKRPAHRQYEPFGAGSWRFLNKLLKMHGLERDQLYITNAVKTPYEPGKKPRKKIVEEHYPLLIDELQIVKPKRILALGVLPAQVLCPGFTNLREDHGSIFYNPVLDCEVIPTFHFAAVAYNPENLDYLRRDFERFLNVEMAEPEDITSLTAEQAAVMPDPGEPVFLDIETTGLDDEQDDITMLGLRWDQTNYVIEKPTPEDIQLVLAALVENQNPVIGHNLPFDLYFLFRKAGSDRWDINTRDTMLMAHVAGQETKNLKHLSTLLTDRPGSRAFGGTEDPEYLAEDLRATEDLYHIFNETVGHLLITKLLNKLALYVTQMRYQGVHVDYGLLDHLKPIIKNKVADLKTRLDQIAEKEINWNSSAQIIEFLLSQKVILVETTPTGNYSVRESVMRELATQYPIAQSILDYREAKKELEFYESYLAKTTLEDPFLHPKLHLAGTRTGRLSCSSPNLQQVKRTGPIKTVFTSRWEGGLIGLVDLSQAELRIAALLADDDKFADALLSDDVHLVVSSLIYGKSADKVTKAERKASKAITFGLLYGGSAGGLSQRSGLSIPAVKSVIKELYNQYPGLERSIAEAQDRAITAGYVTTPFGRTRDLKNLIIAYGENDAARKAINTPIQSAASDIGLVIMYHVNSRIAQHMLDSTVIFGVHDSVLMDVAPHDLLDIAEFVQEAFKMLGRTPLSKYRLFTKLPITGDLVLGKSWAAVEDTNENFDPIKIIPCSSL